MRRRPSPWIEATSLKVRRNGLIVSAAVIVAVAVNTDGRRELLGMDIGLRWSLKLGHCATFDARAEKDGSPLSLGPMAIQWRPERACGLDQALDPGQMRRPMATVALRLAGLLTAGPLQRRLGLFLRRRAHTLGQFGIFQGQVELIGRQLLGALAELRALRRAQDVFQPAVGFLRLRQRRLHLGQAGFQKGVFLGENGGSLGPKRIMRDPFWGGVSFPC